MANRFRGGIAQLGERLNGIQEVSGSIPLISTRKSPEIARFQDFFFVFATKPARYPPHTEAAVATAPGEAPLRRGIRRPAVWRLPNGKIPRGRAACPVFTSLDASAPDVRLNRSQSSLLDAPESNISQMAASSSAVQGFPAFPGNSFSPFSQAACPARTAPYAAPSLSPAGCRRCRFPAPRR